MSSSRAKHSGGKQRTNRIWPALDKRRSHTTQCSCTASPPCFHSCCTLVSTAAHCWWDRAVAVAVKVPAVGCHWASSSFDPCLSGMRCQAVSTCILLLGRVPCAESSVMLVRTGSKLEPKSPPSRKEYTNKKPYKYGDSALWICTTLCAARSLRSGIGPKVSHEPRRSD
jgi:hypothetical protein